MNVLLHIEIKTNPLDGFFNDSSGNGHGKAEFDPINTGKRRVYEEKSGSLSDGDIQTYLSVRN